MKIGRGPTPEAAILTSGVTVERLATALGVSRQSIYAAVQRASSESERAARWTRALRTLRVRLNCQVSEHGGWDWVASREETD